MSWACTSSTIPSTSDIIISFEVQEMLSASKICGNKSRGQHRYRVEKMRVGSRIHPSGDAESAAGAGRYLLSEISAWSID